MRRALVAAVAAITFALLAAPAHGYSQGAYEDCYTTTCLDQAKAIGLEFVIAPADAAYADAAHARGMRVIWSANYRTRNAAGFPLAAHPATLGYYTADEPQLADAAAVLAWNATVRSTTGRPTFTVHWGCSRDQFVYWATPFIDPPGFLGNDCYPIGAGGTKRTVAGGIKKLARWSTRFLVGPWFVAQSFAWQDVWPCTDPTIGCAWFPEPWRAPTVGEMRWMRDCALTAGITTIAWFHLGVTRREGRIADLAAAVQAPPVTRTRCIPWS